MPLTDRDRATQQLAEALDHWIGRLQAYGIVGETRLAPRSWASHVIAELESADEQLAAEAALTVAECEPWTDHGRADVPAVWWGTPLGRLVVRAQTSGEMSVPGAQAALGVSRARVYQLLGEGALRRGRAGGITRRSVAQRIAASR